MPAIIKKSSINSFTDSPFVDAIALIEMPRKFNFPNIKHYDGMTDPDDHIAQYRLLHDSNLYKEITKYPCKTMEYLFNKVCAQIKWEEDKVNYTPSNSNRNDERCSRRVKHKSAERRPEPYLTTLRNDRTCDNRTPLDRPPRQPKRTRARVLEYNLSITPLEAVVALKNLGNVVKWPERMSNPAHKRDSTKWCDFHGDHGHKTEDYIIFKFEVVELLKRVHLKEHLTDKGKSTLACIMPSQAKHTSPKSRERHHRRVRN
ncbi:hypothetical protein ACOSQ4_017194 [Xanthoceras sorbifolium]